MFFQSNNKSDNKSRGMRYTKEQIQKRREILNQKNPGYLDYAAKLHRFVLLAVVLRALSIAAQFSAAGILSPLSLLMGALNVGFGYAFYHLILHVQWRFAIPLLVLNVLVGAGSNFDLMLMLPKLPPALMLLSGIAVVQYSYEILFFGYLCVEKNVHRLQELNRLAEAGGAV